MNIRFLTWLDVQKFIRRKTNYGRSLPSEVTRIDCFSDAIEIGISSLNTKEIVQNVLQEWFGDWYNREKSFIELDINNEQIQVEFLLEIKSDTAQEIRPFWQEIAYLESEGKVENESLCLLDYPQEEIPVNLQIIAFYSFKGGVGRTLSLTAHIIALLEKAKQQEKSIKILVIDADLEAPGITYWKENQQLQPSISFLNFLEIYHSSLNNTEIILDFVAKEIRRTGRNEAGSELFVLPSCLNNQELFDTPILPETLVRSYSQTWVFSDALIQLGQKLEVDYIFIDLRSGLSEISSPLMFDPRIQKILVGTLNQQSVSGISLVLEKLRNVKPYNISDFSYKWFDPTVLLNFLTPALRETDDYETHIEFLQLCYQPKILNSEKISDYDNRLMIQEADFAQELLYINGWDDAKKHLPGTQLMDVAEQWAEENFIYSEETSVAIESQDLYEISPLEQVSKLRELCRRYEYAESGESEDLLITEPLQNLARNFQDDLPRVVSIGSKGSGKTFSYIQLSRLKAWGCFLSEVIPDLNNTEDILFYPLLNSDKIKDNAIEIIRQCRDQIQEKLGNDIDLFINSECQDRIRNALKNNTWTQLEWTQFWLQEVAQSIGMQCDKEEGTNIRKINSFLKEKETKIIFLFDGLEDVFTKIFDSTPERVAIKSLVDLPQRLAELRKPNLGMIVFIRRDYVRTAIEQNFGQFESRYASYGLSWNATSFLKLIYWIFCKAELEGFHDSIMEGLSNAELNTSLEKIWGKKLGSDKSTEPHTTAWVFAALTDFNGTLQARDIVRFLFYVADGTIEQQANYEVEYWHHTVTPAQSRLLPPRAIRAALEPCSKKKVQEAREEDRKFSEWVASIENQENISERKVPFSVEELGDLNIDRSTLVMLQELGVLYEDQPKNKPPRYYIPEIFRTGLGFGLDGGARPRVLVLKRKTIGKNFFA